MGSRTSETMTEIEQIRARLDGTLKQLEGRMPPVARIGKAAVAIAGGTVGTGVVLGIAKRALRRKPAKRRSSSDVPIVTVRAGISAPAALTVAAVFAGIRIWEARQRAAAEPVSPPKLSILPTEKRA